MSNANSFSLEQISVLDHYDDNGLFLRKEIGFNTVPAIIKTAADLSSNVSRNDNDYALVVDSSTGKEYKYPCVDAGNTLASAMYFSEYGESLPEGLRVKTAQKLNDALVSFGFAAPDTLTKAASLELGYSTHADNISLEKLFGIENDSTYEVVEDAFDDCSPRGKRRLMLQVKEAGVQEDLPARMTDYARSTVGSDLKLSLDLRKLVTFDKEASEELDYLFEKSASVEVDSLATLLYDFDIKQGLTHLYGKLLPDPYSSVLGTSIEKTAESPNNDITEVGGKEYTRDDLQEYMDSSSNKLEETFGEDFNRQFSEDPVNVFRSLPTTHKQVIAGMIDDSR